MSDPAHKATDDIIKRLSRDIKKEYGKAAREVESKLNDYLKKFKTKDATWQRWVAEGTKTRKQYVEWKQTQIAAGKRWASLKKKLAREFRNADRIAMGMVVGGQAQAYTLNIGFATYRIEKALGINASFTLYDKNTIQRILQKNPRLLPKPGKHVSKAIREGKAMLWNQRQIQSSAIQSILQGDSIPEMAKRLAQSVGEKNSNAMIRNARTMITGAQNAGRFDANNRAREMGIPVEDYWVAVLDERTRTSHREMNGEKRGDDGLFSNGLQYPGDPTGEYEDIMNCRCTIIGQIRGFERDLTSFEVRDDPDVKGMTYDDWLKARPKTRPIDYQKKLGASIKARRIKEYREL